jgi:hypothetical protein
MQSARKIQTKFRSNKSKKLVKRIIDNIATDINCPVCLQPLKPLDPLEAMKVATALPCGHRFHKDCIENGLRTTKKKCPVCKTLVTNIKPKKRPKQKKLTQVEQERQRVMIDRLEQQVKEQGEEIEELKESTLITLQQASDQETRALETEQAVSTIFGICREQFYNYRSIHDSGEYYEFLEEMYNRSNELAVDATVNSYDATGMVEAIRDRNSNRNNWWPWH